MRARPDAGVGISGKINANGIFAISVVILWIAASNRDNSLTLNYVTVGARVEYDFQFV